jgi:Cyclopropane fatty acid synthase and related methyltransferases
MKFDKDRSLIQQKISETPIWIARRQNILKELKIEGGQTIMDVGCGRRPLVDAISFGSRS